MTDHTPTPVPALGRAFVGGMVWGTGGLLVAKFSSFLATIVVGFIFKSGQYGATSAAISGSLVGDILADGGVRRVLITRGDEFPRLARTARDVALAFNVTGATMMLAIVPLYRHSHGDAVAPLITLAVALVLSTFSTFQRIRLSIDMRFAQLAVLGTAGSILRNICLVAFAWYGLGPLAFTLPVIVVYVAEAIYLRLAVGALPRTKFDLTLAKSLLVGGGIWSMLAVFGSALIYRGDYLATSWLLPEDLAGEYFFAFQLVVALFSPLSIGVQAVVQPVMAKLRDDVQRRANAFVRMIRTAVFIATPASMAAAFITPLLIHLIWRGKWDAVAAPVQLLAATECVRQIHHMAMATIDARGEWKRSAAYFLIDGCLVVLAAILGSLVGTVWAVTVFIAIERVSLAIIQTVLTHRLNGGRGGLIVAQVVIPLLLALPIAVAAIVASRAVAADADQARWWLAAAIVPSTIAYAVAARLLVPGRFAEAVALVTRRKTPDVPAAV